MQIGCNLIITRKLIGAPAATRTLLFQLERAYFKFEILFEG